MKTQAPQWFKEFEEKNDARWDRQEKFNSRQEKFNVEIKTSINDLGKRIDNLVSKNKLVE